MQAKILAFGVALFSSFAFSPICSASSSASEAKELQEIQQQLQAVLKELGELKKQHTAQIDVLRRRLDEMEMGVALRAPSGSQEFQLDDLEALRAAAEAEAAGGMQAPRPLEETTFKSGNIGLQALNPEISITGDLLGSYRSGDDVQANSDWLFRNLGIHFEAYLDPYTRFKAAVPISSDGAELGEAYLTRYGVLDNVNLTLGKFRQQFGVVNRWHKHALDWFDFPIPLRAIFGEGGLNQTGASLEWSGSVELFSQELMLQFTDGENPRVFAENSKNRPCILAHYKLYRDLSLSTYAELGTTALLGWNDTWPTIGDDIEDSLGVRVYGLDFTVAWEPTSRMRYRNAEWRSEFYYLDKDIQAPDGSGRDSLQAWGAYTSFQTKITRTVDIGTRLDFYRPDVKDYAALPDLSLFPLAVTDSDANRYQLGLYATWWQSPFVRFRLGFAHEGGSGVGEDLDKVTLQVVFAAGPHKHERY